MQGHQSINKEHHESRYTVYFDLVDRDYSSNIVMTKKRITLRNVADLPRLYLYVCMVTHMARVWVNRVRLPVLHVVS